MKNFHLPLPDGIYAELRSESERARRPVTALAREAIEQWLGERARRARHDAIAEYAKTMAGTQSDLDADLEAAAVDHLRELDRDAE